MSDRQKVAQAEAVIDQEKAALRDRVLEIMAENGEYKKFMLLILQLDDAGLGRWLDQHPTQRELAIKLWMMAGRIAFSEAVASVMSEALK